MVFEQLNIISLSYCFKNVGDSDICSSGLFADREGKVAQGCRPRPDQRPEHYETQTHICVWTAANCSCRSTTTNLPQICSSEPESGHLLVPLMHLVEPNSEIILVFKHSRMQHGAQEAKVWEAFTGKFFFKTLFYSSVAHGETIKYKIKK